MVTLWCARKAIHAIASIPPHLRQLKRDLIELELLYDQGNELLDQSPNRAMLGPSPGGGSSGGSANTPQSSYFPGPPGTSAYSFPPDAHYQAPGDVGQMQPPYTNWALPTTPPPPTQPSPPLQLQTPSHKRSRDHHDVSGLPVSANSSRKRLKLTGSAAKDYPAPTALGPPSPLSPPSPPPAPQERFRWGDSSSRTDDTIEYWKLLKGYPSRHSIESSEATAKGGSRYPAFSSGRLDSKCLRCIVLQLRIRAELKFENGSISIETTPAMTHIVLRLDPPLSSIGG